MTRPIRIQFENAYYHIISRGDMKRYIFKKRIFKQKFLEKMNKAFIKFNVECFAYCIMDNHYHLYIKTPDGNVSDAIKYLNESYANWYSSKSGKPGHVFQGRFKSILIDNDNYSLKLVNYIHLNPVRSGVLNYAEDYEYSSLKYYIGEEKPLLYNLNVDFILEQFSEDKKQAIFRYYKSLIESINNPDISKKIYKNIAIGEKDFLKKIDNKLKNIPENNQLLPTKMNKSRFPEKIINNVKKEFNVDDKDIFSNKKNNIYKKIVIYLLMKNTRMKLAEIGMLFKLKPTSISSSFRRFNKKIKEDEELKKIVLKVEMRNDEV